MEGGPAPGGMWEWTEEGRTVLEGRGRGRAAAPSDWAAEGDPARPLEEHSSEIAFVWPWVEGRVSQVQEVLIGRPTVRMEARAPLLYSAR